MKILLIGSGGREHAIAWKLKESQREHELFIAPGNGGTALYGKNIQIEANDIPLLLQFIKENNIDFVFPGPEAALVAGIATACKEAGVLCFGPESYCANMEGSKSFAKKIMAKAGVPTAPFEVFTDYEAAVAYVRKKGVPLVVKADGLAAGKGVVVAKTENEAIQALSTMMVKKIFGSAGETVVIEDILVGEEVSFIAFCQGETVIPLPSAQDHKAVFDDDKGPNTGGMGAYSPAPILPENHYDEVIDLIIRPVLQQLSKEGHPFSGILYAGLMMTDSGPQVVEFNVRFGDPECQPLLMRLEGDLLDVLLACAEGRLHEVSLTHKKETAVCVVITAKGYPGNYAKGMVIEGIDEAELIHPGKIKVFQAGTSVLGEKTVATGGRVLGVTALGKDLIEAKKIAYEAVEKIQMDNLHYRKDIGSKGIKRLTLTK